MNHPMSLLSSLEKSYRPPSRRPHGPRRGSRAHERDRMPTVAPARAFEQGSGAQRRSWWCALAPAPLILIVLAEILRAGAAVIRSGHTSSSSRAWPAVASSVPTANTPSPRPEGSHLGGSATILKASALLLFFAKQRAASRGPCCNRKNSLYRMIPSDSPILGQCSGAFAASAHTAYAAGVRATGSHAIDGKKDPHGSRKQQSIGNRAAVARRTRQAIPRPSRRCGTRGRLRRPAGGSRPTLRPGGRGVIEFGPRSAGAASERSLESRISSIR